MATPSSYSQTDLSYWKNNKGILRQDLRIWQFAQMLISYGQQDRESPLIIIKWSVQRLAVAHESHGKNKTYNKTKRTPGKTNLQQDKANSRQGKLF